MLRRLIETDGRLENEIFTDGVAQMHTIVNTFYKTVVEKNRHEYIQSDEYRRHLDKRTTATQRLKETFTDAGKQCGLLLEVENKQDDFEEFIELKAFQSGFLSGVAIGFMGAFFQDTVEEFSNAIFNKSGKGETI
jgi:hypothetical protein